MIGAGAFAWTIVTRQLKAEHIVIPDDAEPVLGIRVAGKTVEGPITAYGQAELIQRRALKGSDGKTYADIAEEQNELRLAAIDKGVRSLNSTDPDVLASIEQDPELIEMRERMQALGKQRTTVMNAAFLRGTLFTSVLVYGFAALVMGLGGLFTIVGGGWGDSKKQ